ncbi:hypothetical protein Dda_3108 [Drechslerella dactyloides]|uniref:Uncharacterized protein n=1 Tax=Drechslerella dactyloides TaxID=74499 RepID=A0AAD6NK11_DREDA|nr:hypothetical protein Dda_3108 [Drechslerella dactyloides]
MMNTPEDATPEEVEKSPAEPDVQSTKSQPPLTPAPDAVPSAFPSRAHPIFTGLLYNAIAYVPTQYPGFVPPGSLAPPGWSRPPGLFTPTQSMDGMQYMAGQVPIGYHSPATLAASIPIQQTYVSTSTVSHTITGFHNSVPATPSTCVPSMQDSQASVSNNSTGSLHSACSRGPVPPPYNSPPLTPPILPVHYSQAIYGHTSTRFNGPAPSIPHVPVLSIQDWQAIFGHPSTRSQVSALSNPPVSIPPIHGSQAVPDQVAEDSDFEISMDLLEASTYARPKDQPADPMLRNLLNRVERFYKYDTIDGAIFGSNVVVACILRRAVQLIEIRLREEQRLDQILDTIETLRPTEDPSDDDKDFLARSSKPYLKRRALILGGPGHYDPDDPEVQFLERFGLQLAPQSKPPPTGAPRAVAEGISLGPFEPDSSLQDPNIGAFGILEDPEYMEFATNMTGLLNYEPQALTFDTKWQNWLFNTMPNTLTVKPDICRQKKRPLEPAASSLLYPDRLGEAIVWQEDHQPTDENIDVCSSTFACHRKMRWKYYQLKGSYKVFGIAVMGALATINVFGPLPADTTEPSNFEMKGSQTYDLLDEGHRKEFLWLVVNAYSDALTGRAACKPPSMQVMLAKRKRRRRPWN